jgi:pimeloyl-ACP methyl ester carboxylesterase
MPRVDANGIQIAFETIGNNDGRPLLLIMGLATQMIGWPDKFCRMLADAGHRVIRFDNRDCGLSSKLEHLGVPDLGRLSKDIMAGHPVDPPYLLSDLAHDAIGLMDAIGIETAHVCGISMGGMIAQIMAVDYPERIRSLISMESTTGRPGLPGPEPAAQKAMLSLPPVDRDAYLDYSIGVYRAFSGGSDKLDEDLQRRISARSYDRMFYPIGFTRQMAAIMASPGRREMLERIKAPTLVIHGDRDTLIPVAHAEDTTDVIKGARLLVVKGLGHGISYPQLWEEIVNAISQHTVAAELRF